MLIAQTLQIPDVLGGTPEMAEGMLRLLPAAAIDHARGAVTLDLAPVRFVRPFGAVVLVESCRYLARAGGGRVRLTGMREDVYRYLRRIDFFDRVGDVADPVDRFDAVAAWERNPASANVLALSTIADDNDVYKATGAARRILGHWLGQGGGDVDKVVRLLAEACGNAVDHSGDVGTITIQKYEHPRCVEVCLAIGDGGRGIRGSLNAAHGYLGDTDSAYIREALGGLSARGGGQGGGGLADMRRKAVESGGSFYLRSGTASLTASSTGSTPRDGLVHLPGTQIAITFRSERR